MRFLIVDDDERIRRMIKTVVADISETVYEGSDGAQAVLRRMLVGWCLARRMLASVGPVPRASRIHAMCESLCDCLEQGRLFDAGRASTGPLTPRTRGPQPVTRTL